MQHVNQAFATPGCGDGRRHQVLIEDHIEPAVPRYYSMIHSLIATHDVHGARRVFTATGTDQEFAFGDALIARDLTSSVHRLS